MICFGRYRCERLPLNHRPPQSAYDDQMTKVQTKAKDSAPSYYFGADVPMSVIRRFARQVVERFHPDKIILFGSHVRSAPQADSDVDILVIMPTRNELDQGFRIHSEILPPFALDIVV